MNRRERRRQEKLSRQGAVRGGGGPAAGAGQRVAEMLGRAEALQRVGQPAEARRLYEAVLAIEPDRPEALAGCAAAAFHAGDLGEAIRLLGRAVAVRPDFVQAHNNLGNLLRLAGRGDEAVAAYRRAIGLKPDLPEAHYNLAQALGDAGDPEGAVAAYDRALALRPDHAGAHAGRGLALFALGRLDEAVEALRRAVELRPGLAEARYDLGNALQARGELDEALAAYGRAIALKPDLLDGLFNVGKPRHVHALLAKGDAAGAVRACDDYLRRRPGHSCALALKAAALNELGDREATRALVDFDRFIRPKRFEVAPSGFADMAAFNAALAEHIRHHPTLAEAPSAFSVHRGKSTAELLVEPRGPVAAFEAMIRGAIGEYQRALPEDAGHPFVANMPRRWRLNMWAIVIEAQGYQVPHIHPSGWLSAVYYVRLPEVVRADDPDHAGWIEFGRPYWDVPTRVEPEVRFYRPEEGLMLMFPSYVYHRTVPFEGAEQRISISFDVLPEG